MEYEQQRIIISNIDRLLDSKKIKRSVLEKIAGLSRGYLSRLAKPAGGAYNLSYARLKKAADYLRMSTEYLMLNTMGNTTDENSLIDFFESLYSESIEDRLFWNVFAMEQINKMEGPEDSEKLGPIATEITRATPDDLECFPERIAKQVDRYLYEEIKRGSFFRSILWSGWLSLGCGRKIGDIVYGEAEVMDDFFYTNIEKISSIINVDRIKSAAKTVMVRVKHLQIDQVQSHVTLQTTGGFLISFNWSNWQFNFSRIN